MTRIVKPVKTPKICGRLARKPKLAPDAANITLFGPGVKAATTAKRLNDKSVVIEFIDSSNSDAASLELTEEKDGFNINYWDGYALAESEQDKDLKKALKIFKRMAKKMAKNLRRFSQ